MYRIAEGAIRLLVMSSPLPALRMELDIMPSPLEDQPGLLMRDPFLYTEQTIIVPPLLAQGLRYFDGRHTDADLRAYLTQATGEVEVSTLASHLLDTLETSPVACVGLPRERLGYW